MTSRPPAGSLPCSSRIAITALGAQGDGVGQIDGRPVFVAGALPGETVEAEIGGERGRLLSIIDPSPDRIAPFCTYFGACGGCAVQHLAPAPYRAWKRGLVTQALGRAGLGMAVGEPVDAHGRGRRRVTFHARRQGSGMAVGFMAARSHDLVPIAHCPVLVPELAASPAVAQAVADAVRGSGKPLDIQITASRNGLDLDLRGHGPASERLRLALAELAGRLDLARLSLHGDIVVERRRPDQRMGKADVAPPPAGFLQATEAGEHTLGALVAEAAAGAKRVADLFAGAGPLALRLAERAEVHAVESDNRALAALDRAGRATPGLRRITCETRDLFRRPLLPAELAGFDVVVLDPPRAGAEAQAGQLARAADSGPGRVVYVSCDAASFARDAAVLAAAGYRAGTVAVIDQFRHSPHVELVGVFDAPPRRGKGPRRRSA